MSQHPTIYVLDANLLLRLADTTHPHHSTAQNAIRLLRVNGAVMRTVPQATRFVDDFVRIFWPIPDDPSVLNNWRHLVSKYGIAGRHGHDARYVAAMQSHGLVHLLTFDADFNRYIPEGIAVIHPASVPIPGTP